MATKQPSPFGSEGMTDIDDHAELPHLFPRLHVALIRHLEACGLERTLLEDVRAGLGKVLTPLSRNDSELLDVYQYASDGMLRLQVSMLSGACCYVPARATTTVGLLKYELERLTGILASDQRLMHDGVVMEDLHAIASYNVTPLSPCLFLYRQQHTRIYAIGGRSESGGALDFCETLDLPGCDEWTPMPPLTICRSRTSGATVDGLVYIVGGDDGLGGSLASAEVFDPATSTWRVLPPMRTTRERIALVALRSGMVCAIGGTDGSSALASVEVFDPSAEIWSQMADLKCPRSALAAAVADGCVYAVGGRDGPIILATVERLSEGGVKWDLLPPMLEARHSFAAVALDSCVYALGGYNGLRSLDSVECFDAQTNGWRSSASLATRRSSLAAVAAGRQILVTGGVSRRAPIDSVEFFDATTGMWRMVKPMTLPRESLALVVGG